jgi:hypothetical protein
LNVELFHNTSFEDYQKYWDTNGYAYWDTFPRRTGSYAMEFASHPNLGQLGELRCYVLSTPGEDHYVSFWYHSHGNQPSGSDTFHWLDIIWVDSNGAEQYADLLLLPNTNVWTLRDVGIPFQPEETVTEIIFRERFSGPQIPATGLPFSLDDVSLQGPPPVGRPSVNDFMDRLKDVLENLDVNIGSVYVTQKRWLSLKGLADGATFTIATAGLWDDATRVGQNVTRFWMMNPQVNAKPLTQGSVEYENTITLTGFYQREESDIQEVALNNAAIEILGKLNERATEITDLNTGTGYMGYLRRVPTMSLAVQNGILNEGAVQGHVVQLSITYYEEVSK